MEAFIKRVSNLLTIKSLVTLILTVAFVYLAITGQSTAEFTTIYTVVIGFYFGTQAIKEDGTK